MSSPQDPKTPVTPNTQHTYEYLARRAQAAGARACQMMTDGSREYSDIRQLVDEYITNQYAADTVSGQTDTSFGALEP